MKITTVKMSEILKDEDLRLDAKYWIEKKEEITKAEKDFMYYKNGTAGSFKTSLYDTYFKADIINSEKLESVFPELEVCRRYKNETGYWENLQSRWNKK